ncbi:MAG TPA: hypothetical protein VL326_24345 [Kofleriaceae bacterium]|nr:hypothetical protein [Kofleriaceae bacterium]
MADDPTACVEWTTWAAQQPTIGEASWGTQLTDIAQHLPARYGDQYWSDDAITAGHETSHGIHAHLRNYVAPQPIGYNAFYVLDNKAAIVAEPHMRKSDIKAHIVPVIRGPRFHLYLEQQEEWDDTPLYVFDEWNAYVNGAEVGVGQVEAGLYDGQWTDAVMGPLEFTAYALATAATIKDKDPTYYNSNTQFRCFTAYNIKRAMKLYETGHLMNQFSWQTQEQYAVQLRTNAMTEPLRQIARELWGADWTQAVLGF